MKTIIAHEWLEATGGAEKVVERLKCTIPESSIATLWNDDPKRFNPEFVSESWIAKTPLRRHKAIALPFMSATWRNRGYSDADTIICSSHLFAHHARFKGPAKNARKLVYAYTPARYIWEPSADGRGQGSAADIVSRFFRPLDRRQAQTADSVVAISNFVANRIEKYWEREAKVIYPPVSVSRLINTEIQLTQDELEIHEGLPHTFLLGASRLVPYKRLEDVIATGVATNLPVVIAGSGPDLPRLKSFAHESKCDVIFISRPSEHMLISLYQRAEAFVFPALEDFGIMPVEAMALGTPVIGLNSGGVAETVGERGGVLVDSFRSKEDLIKALEISKRIPKRDLLTQAMLFDEPIFDRGIQHWLEGTL